MSRQFPSFVTASAHGTLDLSRDAQTISTEKSDKEKTMNAIGGMQKWHFQL